jgi:hypothetical protein
MKKTQARGVATDPVGGLLVLSGARFGSKRIMAQDFRKDESKPFKTYNVHLPNLPAILG